MLEQRVPRRRCEISPSLWMPKTVFVVQDAIEVQIEDMLAVPPHGDTIATDGAANVFGRLQQWPLGESKVIQAS